MRVTGETPDAENRDQNNHFPGVFFGRRTPALKGLNVFLPWKK
jgi:hypothetical protein